MSRIVQGDAFDVLADMDAESIHAVVTDPPYGLAFMGRDWDDFEPKEYQAWCEEWAALCLNVLKPGGHLLAFSGNRTHHRLFSGVEDAGFEVRDTLTWHYGSGFPKALDVSKAIDKAEGAERQVGELKTTPDGKPWSDRIPEGDEYRDREATYDDSKHDTHTTIPATAAAREWDGWKTALKPATEFIDLARKPFEGTVAENVQTHGTAALNIDGCRVEIEESNINLSGGDAKSRAKNQHEEYKRPFHNDPDAIERRMVEDEARRRHAEKHGRYPGNVVFDSITAVSLDRQVGELGGGDYRPADSSDRAEEMFDPSVGWNQHSMDPNAKVAPDNYGGSGGPSRYFYTSKASRAERTLDGKIDNTHPTVKPLDLMEWLVKLVTAEGQTVLDPFTGTGTTCRAAKNLGREFIGIEKQAKWADVSRARCGLDVADPDVLTPEEQATLTDGGLVLGEEVRPGGDA